MPVIGDDHGHPWQTTNLIPRTTKTEEVVLLSDDPTVEQGNVSACQHVDVIFHQASTFGMRGTSGRCKCRSVGVSERLSEGKVPSASAKGVNHVKAVVEPCTPAWG